MIYATHNAAEAVARHLNITHHDLGLQGMGHYSIESCNGGWRIRWNAA
jgi:hypothetical protein